MIENTIENMISMLMTLLIMCSISGGANSAPTKKKKKISGEFEVSYLLFS